MGEARRVPAENKPRKIELPSSLLQKRRHHYSWQRVPDIRWRSCCRLDVAGVCGRHGTETLARLVAYADAGTDPVDFTEAPARAAAKALDNAGLKVADIDFWEINEAFSVVGIVNEKQLCLDARR